MNEPQFKELHATINGTSVTRMVDVRASLTDLLRKRAAWILRKQAEFAVAPSQPPPRRYVSGENFAHLGRQYRLSVTEGEREWVKLTRTHLEVITPNKADTAYVRAQVDAWLRRQRFDDPARQVAFESDYEAVANIVARRDRLDAAIEAVAADSEFTAVVRRLGCLRGISTLTAFGLAVEIGDWHRFTGSSIGAFVGLTPSESSSGASRSLGSITKTGNTHARRLLVEAAWHHRRQNRAGKVMLDRWQHAPMPARLRGQEGNARLHARWRRFDERGKRPTIANVAIARELAGWCWSLAVLEE